jgi:hypothetical protein
MRVFSLEHRAKLSEKAKARKPNFLGHHHSEETKKMIGILKKGNKNCLGKHWIMPMDARKRISEKLIGRSSPLKGIKISEEHRINIVNSLIGNKRNVGRKATTEERLYRSKYLPSGENHYKWQGGITKKNELIRKSIEYRLWREAIFARDNWTCQTCRIRGGNIHSHHIKPFSLYPELRFALDNGITLCKTCHNKEHLSEKGLNYDN